MADQDQTPHNVALNQGLYCFKQDFPPDTPKMTNTLVQHIAVEESTSVQEVNLRSSGPGLEPAEGGNLISCNGDSSA